MAMGFKPLFTGIDIEEGSIEQVVVGFGGTVFDDDVLEFREPLSHLGMVLGEGANLVVLGGVALEQGIDILKHGALFVLHVFANLAHVLVEKL